MMTESKLSKSIRAVLISAPIILLAACGDDGKDGVDGVAGTDGLSSLTKVETITATDACPNGATTLHAGIDTNANGELDDSEIQSSSTVCSAEDATSQMIASTARIKFESVEAPSTNYDKRQILVGNAKVVDGTTETPLNVSYHTLARSGDMFDDVAFGQLINSEGQPLYSEDGARKISNSNEYTSLLPVGDRLFSVSQIESRPGAMFMMELDQNKSNGELNVKKMWQLDMSGVDGGWVHCAGSVTPWNTHLASEEYEPNARSLVTGADALANSGTAAFLEYFDNDESKWNAYQLGWPIEVAVDGSEATPEATLTKHYSVGRMAFELAYVMPDQKTTYMTDDGTNVGLYMYIADTAGDLSAGTLYAMKWNQTSAEGQGAADLTWIDLGHATDAEIKPYVSGDSQVAFTDIFETADPVDGVCPDGFTSINQGGIGQECLKVKTGMEKIASRLETRRYAALMGATTELRKEEGITFDETRNKLYLAMSEIGRGMEDFKSSGNASNSYDLGGSNDIKLSGYNTCGGVYQLDVAGNTTMGSDYVATNISGLIQGIPAVDSWGTATDVVANADVFNNGMNNCNIDGIANPDNVTYMSGHDQLIIGEDTGSGHQNDVIWALDLSDNTMARIQTTPYGSETTSPYWYPNINGWAYLTSVVQHPYGESDGDKSTDTGEDRAYTGYVGPFPAQKSE
ncbi:alkaline phosphatase PhoX [Pseudocolwellia sp. AS88]|uniref:alkaline phosphatase PhoX n=1 Tax=Pseudocolwellia sp. AS88 TaxID=3063958 RepID=UPI0026EE8AC5|nr:alkaline phosphatase PhoX [Pseudocolwellia sp. AS88]MDO7085616.1 DUF839 domain-containing protein [Pseudocolwellia sp. AS88]